MTVRTFHGDLTPADIATSLYAKFNRGNLRALRMGNEKHTVVQIATRDMPAAGGQTALTVMINQVEDGVAIEIGKQTWMGVAASLGQTAFAALLNPMNLLGRLDDVAQDIENLQLSEQVWKTVEDVAQTAGASFELSERLRRLVCAYCKTANPVGAPACIACGAPLGEAQPQTCRYCGYVVRKNERICPNCQKPLLLPT
jgi:RNase P subunit RPR2